MITLMICDDQDVVCQGLNTILSNEKDLKVVGMAADGQELLEALASRQPDMVLMDLKMPIMNGVQATRAIKERYPNVRILILTTYDADEWVFDAIRSGADGFLLKDSSREELLAAIRDLAAGKTPIDPAVGGKLFSQLARQAPPGLTSVGSELSEREREILALLAEGLNNHTIADRLHLSEGTVRNYVSSIFAKLNVTDRTQAAVLAIKYGITSTKHLLGK
ncbi:MAG: response regulator transcription factor [Anaerolineaceae bacterium]|nr:response regulator transcription factor [Anaerolineaceae bacterium]MBN2678595.1 response regulator transcription factor [Anaerolineaceae bacterium]